MRPITCRIYCITCTVYDLVIWIQNVIKLKARILFRIGLLKSYNPYVHRMSQKSELFDKFNYFCSFHYFILFYKCYSRELQQNWITFYFSNTQNFKFYATFWNESQHWIFLNRIFREMFVLSPNSPNKG